MCFWNNLHQVCSKSKDWKAKFFFLKSLRVMKAKGPKQDSRIWPTVHIREIDLCINKLHY